MSAHTIASSPRLKRIVGFALLLAYPVKLLTGTPIGLLLTSAAVYSATPFFTTVQPWSLAQLIMWFDDLGVEAKVGIASSMVTVLGFFVALQTTMHSWQKQTTASMRIAAADSIDRVVGEIDGIILKMWMFSEALAREVSRVRAEGLSPGAVSILSPLSEDLAEFRVQRQRLLQLEQELLALPARYALLFVPLSDVPSALDSIAHEVATVTKRVWAPAPAGGTESPDHRRVLVQSVDTAKFADLARACESAHKAIAGHHGAARGVLLGPVFEMNPRAFVRTLRVLFGMRED